MLSVFIQVTYVILMLLGTGISEFTLELDSLNDPTPRPIPGAHCI
jgi:hypothetical protein